MQQNIVTINPLFDNIALLIEQAKQHVITTVNTTMVHTYFQIGRMIVEEEQQGKQRAAYGKHLVGDLSVKLTTRFGQGFSQRNLEQMRQFYIKYTIPQTLSAELKLHNFTLSW